MHSLQVESNDAEQIHNPWSVRASDQGFTPSTVTARNRPRVDTVSDDTVSPLTAWQNPDMILTSSPIQTEPTDNPMQETNPDSTDPRIASLKAIFPDFDDAVILSVLESTNDDHDRALDVLLGMNDPSFVPPNPPPAPSPPQFHTAPSVDAQRLSQEALDEQLARRLALEEQQGAQAWQPHGPGGPGTYQAYEGQTMYQSYQPRRGGRGGWGSQGQGQPQAQGQGGRDTMTEFQEGFSRIAESGKKTFSSLMSKVRAKMQEFDQGQGRPGSQNPPPEQASQFGPSSYAYAPPQQQSAQGAYAQPTIPQRQPSQWQPAPVPVRTNSLQVSPPRSGVRPAAPEAPQQSSYYDPNARGYDLYGDEDEEEIQVVDKRTPSVMPAVGAAPVSTTAQSTTAAPAPTPLQISSPSPPPPSDTSSPPSYASPVSPPPNGNGNGNPNPTARLPSSSPPARSLSPATGTRSAPAAPGSVDFSKLGLLPKRPISLVRPQSPATAGAASGATVAAAAAGVGVGAAAVAGVSAPRVAAAHSESTTKSTDTEEPEFLENPFEDQ